MTSNIDTTFPPDDERVSKSEMRAQFATIKTEIDDLQRLNSVAWQIAIGILDL